MKPTFRLILGGAAVTALLLTGGSALAQISNTKHNLGTGNTRADENRSNVADLCVFCHTPHGADTGASAPLWNRNLNDTPDTTYQTYDQLGTSTLDGNVLSVGSVSLACLSCHDGTQALDTVLNAPGSGGFNANGARILVGGAPATWQGPRVITDPASPDAGKLAPGVISNLGTDLTNDHPVGIIYGGFSRGNDIAGNPILIDPDFKTPSSSTIGSGATVWWVDTDATGGTREKTDMQLYTRATPQTGGGTLNEPYVECASCHDPHIDRATFLRIDNTASAVCLACHTK